MDEQVIATLNSLETSFNALITSLTTTPSYSNAPSAAQSLLAADDSLTTALEALHTHQGNYARIVHLRAEAIRLEEQIKGTIRTCIDLRKEIGSIHPSILSHWDDAEDSDIDEADHDVDYHTLLSFASKIGKHNTAAAKAAEQESIRRLIQARKDEEEERKKPINVEQSKLNGSNAAAAAPPTAGAVIANVESASQNLIPQHEKDWLEAEAAMARARAGMAFPAAESLRKGALGRLQWVREQEGEEAVEREVERMIAEAEGRPTDYKDEEVKKEENPTQSVERAWQQSLSQPSRPQQAPRPLDKKKSVALDLDLWNEDDDDED